MGMGELIEDLIKTKVPPPAYRHRQESLTKVCMQFYCFIHSFHEINIFFFVGFFLFRLKRAVFV